MLEAQAAYRRRPGVRPARRGRHRGGQQARPVRRGERFPGTVPDVGLGRRAHLGTVRGGAAARRAAGIDIEAMLEGAAAMDRADPGPRRPPESRGAAGPGLAPRRRRPGRQGHGDPALQGPAGPVQPVPAAAGHGVAGQGEGPGRQRRAPGHRRLRQQGLHRPARLRAAAARRRAQLLRHLHRGAAGPGRAEHRGGRRASPPATYLQGFLLGTRRALHENGRPSHHDHRRRRRAAHAWAC